MQKLIVLSAVTCFAISLVVANDQDALQENEDAPAQTVVTEERLAIETRDRDTPAMRGLRNERTLMRRVPNGFGPLVSNAQREEIYQIQAQYFELISLLELRAELLRRERDAKIEGVLSPAQLERLRQSRPATAPGRNLLGR